MPKQRGHNEGSINQRSDGRWEARIHLGYEGGKRKIKSIYGKTRAEVSRKMVAAQAEVQSGRTLPDEKVTVEKFLATWLDGTAKSRVRPNTLARYAVLVRSHIVPHIGRVPIGRLTPSQVQSLWQTLERQGLAPRTIVQVRAVLRTALNQAVRHGLTNRNCAALTDAPKVADHKSTFLDSKQAETLLEAFNGHKLEAFVTLALTTGMRAGEILGLTWGDIDFESRTLTIRQQQQRIGSELVLTAPKTDRSARTIPLTQLAVDALALHRRRQIELLAAIDGSPMILSGRVFVNERGAPLENATALRQFQRRVSEVGLPRMRLHDLRHSCATLLLSRGVHPRVVMELLGHSTIAMTMNVYSHVVPQIARDAAHAMESVFAPKIASEGR